MASKRQRDLDRLIESAGARVYDEESGCWGHGESDESGWGLSSLTNVVRRAVSAPMSLARRGISTSMRLAALPRNIARRGYRMVAPGSPPPAAAPEAGYPAENYQQQPQLDNQQDQGYPDPNYPDQGY